jgi:crossover junction endodeoxyribonuclease RuvC
LRVIGIDPGLTRTGFAVVDRDAGQVRAVSFGVLRTSSEGMVAERLAELGKALAALLVLHRPDVAAVERLFFNTNARTAMSVGQASGVVLACAADHGVDVSTYTPTEVKQSVAGFGHATKHQIQVMVTNLLHLGAPPKPADAADACALAICHLNRAGLAHAITKALE